AVGRDEERGFPLERTELMARERGLDVDVSWFGKLMDQQRERARKAQKKQVIELASDIGFAGSLEGRKIPGHEISATKFLGYDFLETEAVVETVLPGQKPEEPAVVLDRTPCYPIGRAHV